MQKIFYKSLDNNIYYMYVHVSVCFQGSIEMLAIGYRPALNGVHCIT